MSIAKTLPILWLTARQFKSSKATRVVGFFAAISLIMVAIYLLGKQVMSPRAFLAHTYFDLLAPTVIPLATLILATSAFGNEIGDRTLSYLVLKPVGRWRIVLEKYLGVVIITGAAFLLGLILSWGLVLLGGKSAGWDTLVSMLLVTASGILAYGALFLMVGLVIPRALLVGIIYILLWESLLARFIPGIKLVSVRHFTQSIFVQTLRDSPVNLSDAIQLNGAIISLIVLVVLSLTLATLRLRQMDLD